jgi:hypothetical protein
VLSAVGVLNGNVGGELSKPTPIRFISGVSGVPELSVALAVGSRKIYGDGIPF